MDVISYCPLRAAAVSWQPRPGSHALTVVCKATFDLLPGESPLAKTQEEPWPSDAYWSDDPRRSLRAAGDMVPFKRRTDVLVLGQAFAPTATPVISLAARVAVGSIDKTIEVHADRAWTSDGRLVTGEPFVAAPLTWERAARSADNPAGVAPNGPPDERGLRRVPNIVPRGLALRSPADPIPAVGLGPIAPAWPPRASLLGRLAGSWDHRAWSAGPLPEELDGAFFNAAPADQQLAELRGDETIVLEHLSSTYAHLTTRLAKVRPVVTVRRASGEARDVRLRADTLCIDTVRAIATLVWRGVVLLGHAGEAGVVAVTMDGAAPAPRADVDEALMLAATSIPALEGAPAQPALPFVPAAAAPSPALDEARRPPATPDHDNDSGAATLRPWVIGSSAVLPFHSNTAPAPVTPSTAAPAPVAPSTAAPALMAPLTAAPPLMAPSTAAPAPVSLPALGVLLPIGLDKPPTTQKGLDTAVDPPAATPRPASVAPPAMIGPLAKADAAEAGAGAGAREAEQAAPPPEPAPKEPEEPAAELTLEETATIAAELAEGKAGRAEILDAHGVGEGAWRANERRWNEALAEEQNRGKNALRGAYDAAYTARVERFRGPVTIEEYARIMVGLERGRANGVLDALKIQRPALMPIVRVWAKRVAKDARLSEEAAKALRQARLA